MASGINPMRLSIGVGVLNALFLPIVFAFVFSWRVLELPEPLRLKGWYALVVGVIFMITTALGLYSSIYGVIG